jgi:hypothetical protein
MNGLLSIVPDLKYFTTFTIIRWRVLLDRIRRQPCAGDLETHFAKILLMSPEG